METFYQSCNINRNFLKLEGFKFLPLPNSKDTWLHYETQKIWNKGKKFKGYCKDKGWLLINPVLQQQPGRSQKCVGIGGGFLSIHSSFGC
jgi:hypothetical protein